MTRLAANLSLMFADIPFLDRFAAAANAGFDAVEFMFPYSESHEAIAARLAECGLSLALFNLPAGAWSEGERGIGALPGREVEFRDGLATALSYARQLGCKRLHLMAGKTEGLDPEVCRAVLIENVRHACDLALAEDVEILLEPINTRVDVPGYFYGTTAAAMSIITEAARPNLRLQYDIYHMQIMEGDLARTIERLLPAIGHIQIADNPGRHEPGSGEINYPWLLSRLEALGYEGFVGCEYVPANGTLEGLDWAAPYLRGNLA